MHTLSKNDLVFRLKTTRLLFFSAVTDLLEATNKWKSTIAQGNTRFDAMRIFFKLQTLDTVDHEILLSEPCVYGFPRKLS